MVSAKNPFTVDAEHGLDLRLPGRGTALRTAGDTRSTGVPSRLKVRGGSRLSGTAHVAGFKHALVSLTAAACAGGGRVTLHNCPDLVETSILAELIEELGGRTWTSDGSLTIEPEGIAHGKVNREVASRIHGSVYLLPALVGRFGQASVSTNGGCLIGDGRNGSRPVSHYIDVFKRFGARAQVDDEGHLQVSAARLTGCELDLLEYTTDRYLRTGPFYSGASKMALLCAAVGYGRSTLRNLYPKPDVTALIEFLRSRGAAVEQASPEWCVVHGMGPDRLGRDVEYTLPADLVEIVTWICAGAMLGENRLKISGTGLSRAWEALSPERALLEQMGVPVSIEGGALVVQTVEQTRPVDVVVSSPGIYSDCQPFFCLLATRGRGRSRVTETVWPNRFDHISGLNRLGARLSRVGSSVMIEGGHRPHVPRREIFANDLRSAATLLLAALEVDGETLVGGAEHLARGYPDFPSSLRLLGARIEEFL